MKPDHLRPKQSIEGNLTMFGSVGLVLAAWSVAPSRFEASPIEAMTAIVLGAAGAVGAGYAARTFYENYLGRKSWETLQTPYTEKDDRTLDEKERIESGMREPTGRLIGRSMDGEPLFSPTKLKPAFSTIIGGQGTGKTTTSVINSTILTPLTSGASVFIADPKKEIMPGVIRSLKELGFDVICANIGPEAQDIAPCAETPPLELAIDG
ncbi:MAG: hypothetical protein AAGH38_01355, partial [Pseudomonadota bacterium]